MRIDLLRVGLVVAVGAVLSAGLRADSNVRIVRMSFLSGAVEVQLPDGKGWRPGLQDMPVVANEQIRTLANGRAEIQFENGSALRLIPDSQVTMTQLALGAGGEFETTARLDQGTAFATLLKPDDKDFHLQLGSGATVTPSGDTKLRLSADQLQVLDGHAEVEHGGRALEVKKNEQMDLSGAGSYEVAGLSSDHDPWTKWSQQRDEYYTAAFRLGVQPASLSTYVNWNAATELPAPKYADNSGLQYTGSPTCPWAVATGDYAGYCWSATNGWFKSVAPQAMATAVTSTGNSTPAPMVEPAPGLDCFTAGMVGYGLDGGFDPFSPLTPNQLVPYNTGFYGSALFGAGMYGDGLGPLSDCSFLMGEDQLYMGRPQIVTTHGANLTAPPGYGRHQGPGNPFRPGRPVGPGQKQTLTAPPSSHARLRPAMPRGGIAISHTAWRDVRFMEMRPGQAMNGLRGGAAVAAGSVLAAPRGPSGGSLNSTARLAPVGGSVRMGGGMTGGGLSGGTVVTSAGGVRSGPVGAPMGGGGASSGGLSGGAHVSAGAPAVVH